MSNPLEGSSTIDTGPNDVGRNRAAETACPSCGSKDTTLAATVSGMPVHVGVLWPSADSARACPRGDMELVFCHSCGFLFNAAFEEGLVDYSLSYDNALHHSAVFKEYELALAHRLIDRYEVRRKTIAEIGCGSAHFLGLMCQLGENRGFGFDPSHDPEFIDELAVGRVEVRREYYDQDSADIGADLICARHVLEHVADPAALLTSLRAAIGDSTVVYFEVPNALLAIEQLSIWDLMYEHCGYYTTGSLRRLFRSTGFDVIDVRESYEGQFIGIEAKAGVAAREAFPSNEHSRLSDLVSAYSGHVEQRRRTWNERLIEEADRGSRVVVWGAGGKGVSFMNFLDTEDRVDCLVDVNPRKQGMYLAGTGHEIVAPARLAELRPDLVIVLNPLYEAEIAAQLKSLGLGNASVESVT